MSASFVAILDEHEKSLKKALDAAKESPDSWAGGPRLEDYLPPGGADYLSNLLALVGQDLEMRLARGMDLSAVSYVERFPTLRSLGGELFYLVEREIHWKAYWKLPLDAEYLVESFPQLSHSILEKLRQKGILPPEIPGFDGLEKIGRGGMGVVYRATETRLNRLVALKVIRPDRVTDPDHDMQFRQRFQEEAEKMAAVSHPHVVQVFQSGQVGEQVFLAMEYVPGETLQGRINREGRLGFREAAEVVEKIALGVAAVHVTGTIHRDLKPENVLVSDKGVPKVADFGLARQIEPTDGATQEGVFRGTAEYASPEQASMGSQDLTERTDVYGLGGILYACLTGRPPFPSHLLSEVLRRVVNEPVEAIRGFRPDCPRDLETICLKCLEKDPKRRYQSAVGLAEDLRRYQEGKPILARPVGVLEKGWLWARRNRALAGALASTLLILLGSAIGFGGLSWWALAEKDRADEEKTRASKNESLARKNEALAREKEIFAKVKEAEAKKNEGIALRKTKDAEREKKVAEEERRKVEDNLYISTIQRAQSEWKNGDPEIAYENLANVSLAKRGWEHHYISTLMSINNVTFWVSTEVHSTCFSPDGKRVATGGADGSLKVFDALSGKVLIKLKKNNSPLNQVCFSPDGKQLLSAGDDKVVRVWDASNDKEIRVLKGHTEKVNSVAFSPDGKQLASAGDDKVVRLWDASNGKQNRVLKGHTEKVNSVAFSPDGKQLASAGDDKVVRLWDAATGKEMRVLKGHTEKVNSVAFSPDGKQLASAGDDKVVRLWDAATGKEKRVLKGHTEPTTWVTFSLDGKWLASSGFDKHIRVWDAINGDERWILKGHTGHISSIDFSPDGKQLLSSGMDKTIKIWADQGGRENLTLEGNSDTVNNVCFSPDGKMLATAGQDNSVKLWDSLDGSNIRVLIGHTKPVNYVTFSPDGKRAASASKDNSIRLWDVEDGSEFLTLRNHTEPVNHVSFSPDGKRLVSSSDDDSIKIWDVERGAVIRTIRGHKSFFQAASYSIDGKVLSTNDGEIALPVFCAIFSVDGKRIISAGFDRKVRFWEVETGKEIQPPIEQSDSVSSLKFNSDGKLLVCVGGDKVVRIIDGNNGTEIRTLSGHNESVTDASFSEDGRRLATSSLDKTVKIWDMRNGKEIISLKGHNNKVTSVCFSPDGKRIATASSDKTVIVWDARTEMEALNLAGHTGAVTNVSFSPVGGVLASSSRDRSIKLWDINSGREIKTLKGHRDHVLSLSFSPDGKRLASGSWDQKIILWDISTGMAIRPLIGHSSYVTGVTFSHDGKRLASSSMGAIKVWDIDSGKEKINIPLHLQRNLFFKKICFSADDTVICGIDENEIKRFWAVESGQEINSGEINTQTGWDFKSRYISPDGSFTAESNGHSVQILNNRLRQERSFRERKRLAEWSRPNPQWHLDQAKESESAQLPFSTAFHLAWARRCGAWKPQVTTDLWKNLQATRPSPARDKLQAQVLGEDVGRMILAGTSATQGNWAPSFFSTRFIFN